MRPEPGERVIVTDNVDQPYLGTFVGYITSERGELYVIRPKGWGAQLVTIPDECVAVHAWEGES